MSKAQGRSASTNVDANSTVATRQERSSENSKAGRNKTKYNMLVTNDDIDAAQTFLGQLKVKIQFMCTRNDLEGSQKLLKMALDLDAADVRMIGKDMILHLEQHVESLKKSQAQVHADSETKQETDAAGVSDTSPVAAREPMPLAPAHRAMKQLKLAIASAHGLADKPQGHSLEVAARVTRVLDDLENELSEHIHDSGVKPELNRALVLSAATAMAELMIHGFTNPAAQNDGDGFHPACGSKLNGDMFRRASLILARVLSQTSDHQLAVCSAAWGSGRLAALWSAEENLVAQALRKSRRLCAEDALNYACMYAADCRALGGCLGQSKATGLSIAELAKLYVNAELFVSQQKMTTDDVPRQMVGLLLNSIRSRDLPELAIGGAWRGVLNCVVGRPSVGRCAFECGVFELIVETLRTIGGPIEWLAFEKRSNGDKRVVWATQVAAAILRTELTQTYKADAQFQRSGLIQEFVGAVNALDALRRNKRNVEKLTINTANGSEMDDVGIRRWHQAMALSDDIERSHEELLSLVYSAVLYSILSVLSDHSHDGEVDKLLKVVQHAQEFASDAAFASELQRQHQQMVQISRVESKRQAAATKSKSAQVQARRSWDSNRRNVDKAVKHYNLAWALNPNNDELREKVRVVGAARYAEAQKWRQRIAESAIKPNLELSPCLGTATTHRPAIVGDFKVERAIKAEIREGTGHHIRGFISPRHGWPETSRKPLRGSFERVSR